MFERYELPPIALTPVDVVNRRAAATGSMRYAAATAYADYNGHAVSVGWNDYRQYWVAEYFWAGRMVIGRGSLSVCLQAARDEYRKGSRGTTVTCLIDARAHESVETQRHHLREHGFERAPETPAGLPPPRPSYWTAKHYAASDAAHYELSPNGWLFAGLINFALTKFQGESDADWDRAREQWLVETRASRAPKLAATQPREIGKDG